MSEFYPTATVSFYETFTPQDDYDLPPVSGGPGEEPVLTGIPMQILTSNKSQYQPVDNRGTTIKVYAARVRGHHPIQLDYMIEDERTGERYSIDDMDKKHNPVGDSSWILTIRKVSIVAGQ